MTVFLFDLKEAKTQHANDLVAAYKVAKEKLKAAKNCGAEGTCDELLQKSLAHLGLDTNLKNPVQESISRPAQP